VNIQIDWIWKNVTMSNSELDVLGIVVCHNNNARRLPEWENIITAGDTEKWRYFSKRQAPLNPPMGYGGGALLAPPAGYRAEPRPKSNMWNTIILGLEEWGRGGSLAVLYKFTCTPITCGECGQNMRLWPHNSALPMSSTEPMTNATISTCPLCNINTCVCRGHIMAHMT